MRARCGGVRRLLGRVALGALVLALLGAVLGTGGWLLVQRYTDQVHQAELLGDAARGTTGTARDTGLRTSTKGGSRPRMPADGPLNVLLVGIDERADNPRLGARADTVVVVHVPAGRTRAYLISLPRDTLVSIPAYRRSGYGGGTDKLNAAFALGSARGGGRAGGFELLALTARQLTGLSFDAGAIVTFDGLRRMVDAVGGVELCVDAETTSVHIGWDARGRMTAPYRLIPPSYRPEPIAGVRPQVYRVGCHHFAGWQALDYVRQRDLLPDGDYGRQRHQQQLIRALAERLISAGMLSDPLAVDRALRAIGGAVTFDGNGASVTDWMLGVRGISPRSITMVRTNGGRFSTRVIDAQAFEILDDTSRALFAAAAEGRLEAFVAAHPDRVAVR